MALQVAALIFAAPVSAQDATSDHAAARIACDTEWDFHKPTSQYPEFLQKCLANNPSVVTASKTPISTPTPPPDRYAQRQPAAPRHLVNSIREAQAYYGQGPSPVVIASARQISPNLIGLSDAQIRRRLIPEDTRQGMQHGDWVDAPSGVIIPGPIPYRSLQEAWNTIEIPADADSTGIDPELEARASHLFPLASQQDERAKYIINEMNSAEDRKQGHSYSWQVR